MAPSVIQMDYDFSPYSQKTRLLLQVAGVDFKSWDQPFVLPRKDLEGIGITYRRIPLLAVGKDVYADSNRIIAQIVGQLGKVETSSVDSAYQTWSDIVFNELLQLVPVEKVTEDFKKDRKAVFPILTRPDYAQLRPSGLASFHQRLSQFENEFLSSSEGPFINGKDISLADIQASWCIRWAFNDLGLKDEPGFDASRYPKVWKLIDSLPQVKPSTISTEEAHKAIVDGEYTAPGSVTIAEDDPLGLTAGTPVTIESYDTDAGAHPQEGKLIGTSTDEVVIELDNGIRLHFPRYGYVVKAK